MTDKEAFDKIAELCKPGQELYHSQAIDIMCEVWNIARERGKPKDDKAK